MVDIGEEHKLLGQLWVWTISSGVYQLTVWPQANNLTSEL